MSIPVMATTGPPSNPWFQPANNFSSCSGSPVPTHQLPSVYGSPPGTPGSLLTTPPVQLSSPAGDNSSQIAYPISPYPPLNELTVDPAVTEEEIENALSRLRALSSSAISRAVAEAETGKFVLKQLL